MLKKKMQNKKGFTLAELLIVVAIIAVLVAISIPIFTTQLEKSREATDAANIRAAYAEIAAIALTDPDVDHKAEVTLKQTKAGWQNNTLEIAGVKVADANGDVIGSTGTVVVHYDADEDSADGFIFIDTTPVKMTFVE